MPQPIYIICSESGAEDAISKEFSLFKVIERIRFMKLPPNVVAVGKFGMRITAAWRMADAEDGQDFEFEAGVYQSDGTFMSFGGGEFRSEKDKPIRRLQARIQGAVPVQSSGWLRAIMRLRRTGSDDAWLEQEYPIPVEEIEYQPPAPLSAAPDISQPQSRN